MTYSDIKAFEAYLLREEKSDNTVKKYVRDVKKFFLFLNGRDINKEVLAEFRAGIECRYKTVSANSVIAAVNAFLKFSGCGNLHIKQFRVQKKAFCSEEKELTKAEYFRLLNCAEKTGNHRLNLIIQTICGTGIRIGELQFITVEAAQSGEATVRCKNKTRTVFIVRELRKKVLKYAKKNGIITGAIFITRNGNPVCRTNVWREMKKLCEQANVNPSKVFPHNLRHLFARVFYEIEKDIAKLADILGHSSINTTRIYIISTGAEHKRKMEKMHLVI